MTTMMWMTEPFQSLELELVRQKLYYYDCHTSVEREEMHIAYIQADKKKIADRARHNVSCSIHTGPTVFVIKRAFIFFGHFNGSLLLHLCVEKR
jgi:hypothetical protein